MKPIELYNFKPENISKEIGELKGFYYNHVPEIEEELWNCNNERIEIKVYKYHNFDGRRYWKLASVWFDNKPVMIIQNAGREGDDHRKRFVTNKDLYKEMINYIRSILPQSENWCEDDFVDENEDIENLTEFYGYKMNGYFDNW